MVQLKLAPVVCKNLFSRHYLEERLKASDIWRDCQDDAEGAFKKIKELYDKEKPHLEGYNEAQLEEKFIRPIFRILGHLYEVQPPSYKSGLTPDYAFFSDDESRNNALGKGSKDFFKMAVAVGDAKRWGTPLDKKTRGKEKFVYDNPSFQIDAYLRDTDTQWAILTDGRYWRLYNQKSSYKLDSHYEADLTGIIEKDSLPNFKYFFLFFRREAFLKDETGLNFLDRVYSEGLTYAKKVGEDLEKSIYKALKILSQGFLNWPSNKLTPDDDTVEKIHDNSLIYLYRLLFILYADSRGTLSDLHKPGHEDYNINKIKAKAFTSKKEGTLSEHSSSIWDRLSSLFQLIDEGSEARGIPKEELFVPPYNGGLFHPEAHRFLVENKVGDKYVADVLELLSVPPDEDSAVFIDYSTLEIRHLGSIYEGLLEYKLRVADEDLVVVKNKGKEVWIPKEEANSNIIDLVKKGELYLVTDKGERKATGSYYTPDYIVKYIVENTLGPVVEEKLKDLENDEEKTEHILSIKVLDPAMGSGHFLVEATEFLAKRIVPFVRPEQLGDEKDIDWAKREVVKHCIYGVDLNSLATELAKLSLWLSTLEASRPLSFLDHHLKVGNSLIGADIHKLDQHPSELKTKEESQLSLSNFMRASIRESIDKLLNMYDWILERAEEKIEDIKYKEQVFEELLNQPLRRRFIELANIHTSYYFGNEYSKSEYEEALKAFQEGGETWKEILGKEYFMRAQEIAEEKDFYHWKLEFPEIFFEPGKDKENPGFDAVIGNPPYGAELSNLEREYLPIYYNTAVGLKNTALQFMELSDKLIQQSGMSGLIVPKSLTFSQAWKVGRDYFFEKIELISDVSKAFKGVLLEQVIYIASKKRMILDNYITSYSVNKEFREKLQVPMQYWKIADTILLSISERDLAIFKKMIKSTLFFGDISKTMRGLPFQKYLSNEGEYPIYRGNNIEKYNLFKTGDFLDNEKVDLSNEKISNLLKPKILSQRIVAHVTKPRDHIIIMSTVDSKGVLSVDTVENTIISDQNYSLYSLCGLLNSKLISWYAYLFIFSKAIRTMDFDDYYIGKIPLPRISFTTNERKKNDLVDEFKLLYSDFRTKELLFKLESCLVKTEFITKDKKSDVVHDFLAYLAEQMIEYNKQKNEEIKGFLGWLEREIDAKVEDLSNKTAIKEYYKNPFEKLLSVMKKNKNKVAVDPSSREVQDKVKGEFDTSVSKLKPLMEKIDSTDDLIDQIVYKLYGLNEDEIKIVEAS